MNGTGRWGHSLEKAIQNKVKQVRDWGGFKEDSNDGDELEVEGQHPVIVLTKRNRKGNERN